MSPFYIIFLSCKGTRDAGNEKYVNKNHSQEAPLTIRDRQIKKSSERTMIIFLLPVPKFTMVTSLFTLLCISVRSPLPVHSLLKYRYCPRANRISMYVCYVSFTAQYFRIGVAM